MTPVVALLSAIASSLCNGISTVQQKVGADSVKNIHSFDLFFLFRLFKNVPYLIGTVLELGGFGLSLIALRLLPLFLVQSLIAASIIVTAFGERIFLRRKIPRRTYTSLFVVIIGLSLLVFSAVSGHATIRSTMDKNIVLLLPIPIGLLGLLYIYSKKRNRLSALILALLGGLAFGNTSVIGRILVYPHPYWKLLENPLLWSLLVSALLGQYLFSVSLQRVSATQSNTLMILAQTLSPALFGLILFGDQIKPGYELAVFIGIALVVVGSSTTAIAEVPEATI